MTQITEIALDMYRISTFVPEGNLQFNQFLVRDEQPLLFHTGMKGLFPVVREAVAKLLAPDAIRWISFSHFEADECGALTEWQTLAPAATAVCSFVAKVVSVDDVVARRPAQALADGELLQTGKYRFRLLQTPQCRTAGKQACCSRKRRAHYCVRICSTRTVMSSPPQARMWLAGSSRR